MKRLFYLLYSLGFFSFPAFSQTVTLYSENFGTGASLPAGWTTTSPVITPSNTNPSTGYTGASGSGNILLSDESGGGVSGSQTIVYNGVSTVGITNIIVNWFARSDINGDFSAGPILEWSINGGLTWNARTYTNINFDGNWNTISASTLPPAAEGATNLQIRISFPYTESGGTYQIDDFSISGTGAGQYYSKSTGNLNDLATWGTNLDGTGSNPSNFTAPSQTFNIANNPNPTIAAAWTVSGTGTKIVIQSGSNFTIPSGFNATINAGATLDINSGGTLTIANATATSATLSFGTLATGSTVVYSALNLNIISAIYSNLTTAANTQLTSNATVNGVLTLNSQLRINNGSTLTLAGTLAGASDFRAAGTGSPSGLNPNIIINGTGDLGSPLRFTSNGQNVGTLTINRAGGGVVNLSTSSLGTGSGLNINTQANLQQGILAINEISVTFNSGAVLNTTGGLLRGSSNSNVTFKGCGNGGNLIMDTSLPANQTLNNLTIQRPLRLDSDLILNTSLNLQSGEVTCTPLTAGIFSMDNSTFTLSGPSISIASGAAFNTTANSSLVFSGSSAGVNIPSTVTTLRNLTINNSNGVILNSTMTVGNVLTLQNGSFNIGNLSLALNGPVISNGGTLVSDISGTVQYNQSTAGQAVLAGTYGNLSFSNSNKILPAGVINISNTFTPGSATGHTIPAGSTVNFAGPFNQILPAFNYANLSIASVGGGRTLTIPNGAIIGISENFDSGSDTYIALGTHTIDFNGSGNQNIPSTFPYCNLIASTGGIKTLSGNITANCSVTISTGATLATSGNNININGGDFTNSGIFTAGTGDVTFSSSSTQNIAGSSTTTFYSLTLNNTSLEGIVNNANVNIRNVLTLNNSSAKLDADGAVDDKIFTLLSDATGDARIAAVPTGASISGQVVVQRYLANPIASRRYRYLASPVTNATVADWQNEIPITGTFADPSTGTYDGVTLNSTNPSLFYYDETQGTTGRNKDEGYVAYPSSGTAASNPLNNGTGYTLFIRRSSASTPEITIDLKGNPRIGTVNIPFSFTSTSQGSTEDGWNMLGNPFPAPINWSSLALPGSLDGTVYIKSNVGINGTTPGNYVYYNQGTGGVPGSFTGQIASGQAFFIKANASGTLSIPETAKTTSAILYKIQAPSNKLRLTLKGSDTYDETLICFLDNATDKFDSKFDAYKLENGLSTFSVNGDTTKLAINALSQITCNKDLGVSVELANKGIYTLKFSEFENFAGAGIRLKDNFADKMVDVKKDTIYTFSVTDDANSKGKNRFRLVFEKSGLKPTITQTGYYLLTSDSKTGNQWLKNRQPIVGATGGTYLPTEDGNYSVQVTTTDGCKAVSDEIVMKITALEKATDAGMKIYPNPVTGAEELSLELSEVSGKNLMITIYSANGTVVSSQVLTNNRAKSSFSVKTGNLASGLYILKVADGDKIRVTKFVKE